MNTRLAELAARIRLHDPAHETLRLRFAQRCLARVQHLLEDAAVLASFAPGHRWQVDALASLAGPAGPAPGHPLPKGGPGQYRQDLADQHPTREPR